MNMVFCVHQCSICHVWSVWVVGGRWCGVEEGGRCFGVGVVVVTSIPTVVVSLMIHDNMYIYICVHVHVYVYGYVDLLTCACA